jgi:hypothetical protein
MSAPILKCLHIYGLPPLPNEIVVRVGSEFGAGSLRAIDGIAISELPVSPARF